MSMILWYTELLAHTTHQSNLLCIGSFSSEHNKDIAYIFLKFNDQIVAQQIVAQQTQNVCITFVRRRRWADVVGLQMFCVCWVSGLSFFCDHFEFLG